MGEFFKGWRRKIGCVTLLMAAILTGLWVRSQWIRDSLQVRIADNAAYIFISNESELIWQSLRHEATEKVQLKRFAVLKTTVSENRRYFGAGRRQTRKEDYSCTVAFSPIGSWTANDHKLVAWIVPHSYPAIPLTLLSAYLLLWPGMRPPKPATR